MLIYCDRGTGELAFHPCYTPTRVPLAAPVRVAGSK